MARRWPALPPTHLESIVRSSLAATTLVHQVASDRARPTSIIDELQVGRGGGGGGGGCKHCRAASGLAAAHFNAASW